MLMVARSSVLRNEHAPINSFVSLITHIHPSGAKKYASSYHAIFLLKHAYVLTDHACALQYVTVESCWKSRHQS